MQYRKPIMPYLCPQRQRSPDFPMYGAGVWREMLSHIMEHPLTDGAVIYIEKLGQPAEWDDSMPWWQETLEVLGL